MRKRYLIIAILLLIAAAGIGALLWIKSRRAPQAARLLPNADAVLFLNLKPLRIAGIFQSLPKINRDAEYQSFIRQTGFEFERDLDTAAFAVHFPAAQSIANPPMTAGRMGMPATLVNPSSETRFSEIFTGRFDRGKITNYFRSKAKDIDHFDNTEIFAVQVEDRMVRIAILAPNALAVTNVDNPHVIHGMIERAHENSWLVNGPILLREHYEDVPMGSIAWTIGSAWRKAQAVSSDQQILALPGGIEIPVPANTTWIASVRYAGGIELKAQAFTPSDADAQGIAETLHSLLAMFRAIQMSVGAHDADADVKKFFDNLRVEQKKNRVVLAADISPGLIKKIATEAPAINLSASPKPAAPSKPHSKQKN